MLATVGHSQEHLDRTVTTIQSFIEGQKENINIDINILLRAPLYLPPFGLQWPSREVPKREG